MYFTSALRTLVFIAAAAIASTVAAQAPAGATGICKDGSYSEAESKKGACARHGGVKEWYSNRAETEKTATMPTVKDGMKAAPPATTSPSSRPTETAAAGGGPGQVWVNTRSKVYHCQGDKWYGKTMKGEYMTEAAAKAAGSHADHGKACP
jgi:hypothetical protein